MTKQEIIDKIKSDLNFFLGFRIDNNYLGAIQALSINGIMANGKTDVLNKMLLLSKNDKPKLFSVLKSIPYLSSGGDSYTNGLTASDFVSTTTGGKFDLTAILAGLGAGLTGYADASTVNPLITPTDAQLQAQIQAQKEAEATAKKKKTMLIIIGVVVAVVVIGLIWYFVKKGKKKTAPSE